MAWCMEVQQGSGYEIDGLFGIEGKEMLKSTCLKSSRYFGNHLEISSS